MLCATIKETLLGPFQQETNNSSYTVFALIPSNSVVVTVAKKFRTLKTGQWNKKVHDYVLK